MFKVYSNLTVPALLIRMQIPAAVETAPATTTEVATATEPTPEASAEASAVTAAAPGPVIATDLPAAVDAPKSVSALPSSLLYVTCVLAC